MNKPQQPMTIKARKAIEVYVNYHLQRSSYSVSEAINHTLKAERMHRDSLYDWLSNRGYTWRPKVRRWLPRGQRA